MGDTQVDGFRILTWNINGIRSLGDLSSVINNIKADVICVQETKVTRDMLTESVALVPGFSSYFSFSRRRTGYSGVATYCRHSATPTHAEEGLAGTLPCPGDRVGGTEGLQMEFSSEELRELDNEGRCVVTRHKVQDGPSLVVINVYCPRVDPERDERKRYKMQFFRALDVRAAALRRTGDRVVIVGDINCSHKKIDHCEPYEGFEDRADRRFLDHFLLCEQQKEAENKAKLDDIQCEEEEDEWKTVNELVEEKQFLDSFRLFHLKRKEAFTCWNTEKNCRATNYGTRIDYIFSSVDLRESLTECDIQPQVLGSDHCPVVASYNLVMDPAPKPPRYATVYFPEFAGKQVKLSQYFSKSEPGKRKHEEKDAPKSVVLAKKSKVEKKKITNFFAPKNVAKANTEKTDKVKVMTAVADKVASSDGTLLVNNNSENEYCENIKISKNSSAKSAWSNVFKPIAKPPSCPGHQEECVRRKVSKKGPNIGREFWCCGRGEGKDGDPQARCNFFKWVK